MEKLVSVAEYAALNGKDPGNIRRNILSGRIKAQKVGSQWVLDRDTPYPSDKRINTGNYRHWRQQNRLKKEHKDLAKVLPDLTADLRNIYGSYLEAIVLYGSYARGSETEESDIDISLMLREKPTKAMTDRMVKSVASYELTIGKVLSVIDIQTEQFKKWKKVIPFYSNLEKEGIVIWKET